MFQRMHIQTYAHALSTNLKEGGARGAQEKDLGTNLSTRRRFLLLQKSYPLRAFAYVWTEKVTDKSIYVFERSSVNIASP